MTIMKPAMANKTPKHISGFIAGGKRARTTKIAWHYTGAHDVKAINTINNWFNKINKGYKINGKYVYASSHFLCDLDGTIYKYVPMDRIAWTTNSANSYSIGIECATSGKDDHYTDAEYKSMVKLGAWLAQYYKLDPRTDFIRHYDVTKKICPRYFVNNSAKWKQFKLDCYNYMIGKLKDSGIRNCTNGKGNSILNTSKPAPKPTTKKFQIQTLDKLNVRKVADWKAPAVTTVKKGQFLDVVDTVDAKNGSTKMYKLDSGLYITASTKYVKKI